VTWAEFDRLCRERSIGDVGDLCEAIGVTEPGRALIGGIAWYLARQAFGGSMPLQVLWEVLDDDAREGLVRALTEKEKQYAGEE